MIPIMLTHTETLRSNERSRQSQLKMDSSSRLALCLITMIDAYHVSIRQAQIHRPCLPVICRTAPSFGRLESELSLACYIMKLSPGNQQGAEISASTSGTRSGWDFGLVEDEAPKRRFGCASRLSSGAWPMWEGDDVLGKGCVTVHITEWG